MDAFAASLGLRVDVTPMDASSVRRAAQVAERTYELTNLLTY